MDEANVNLSLFEIIIDYVKKELFYDKWCDINSIRIYVFGKTPNSNFFVKFFVLF